MKKLKLILPMLAFVLAIGMSFAFTSATEDDYYATGFIQLEGTWYEVDVNCTNGDENCYAVLKGDENGMDHQVFNAPNGAPLKNITEDPTEIPDPRL